MSGISKGTSRNGWNLYKRLDGCCVEKILPQVNMDNLASAHKRSLMGPYDKNVFFTSVKLSNNRRPSIKKKEKRVEDKNTIRNKKSM